MRACARENMDVGVCGVLKLMCARVCKHACVRIYIRLVFTYVRARMYARARLRACPTHTFPCLYHTQELSHSYIHHALTRISTI